MDPKAGSFGCNTYSYMRREPADACLARLADLGFETFEVMIHPGHLWHSEPATVRDLGRLLASRRLGLVTLNMPNIDINIAAAAPEMREHSLRMLERAVGLAGDLGASGLVIAPGKANPLFPPPPQELAAHFFAALDRLVPKAEAAGTALWVENMPFAFLPEIETLAAAVDTYGCDAVGIVYDVANAHFIGEPVFDGLLRARDRLKLVHLSDTGTDVYRHAPVGSGTVPFGAVPAALAAAGYAARPVLEIVSADPDREIVESAARLAAIGLGAGGSVQARPS
ncbi:sugar phosphate isomerase/epimerase family protein [Propylenella binzhouense]|nr:sugar phosphate isomerase/epimerase family protein [Propylenella binzhouense]